MSHFAEISGSNNIVTNVIVAEQKFIDSGAIGNPSKWIQTSYNTRGGVHYAMKTTVSESIEILTEQYQSSSSISRSYGPETQEWEYGGVVTSSLVEVKTTISFSSGSREVSSSVSNLSGSYESDGGTQLRKNYAGIGYTYDESRDAFIAPQPEPSASIPYVLNEVSCSWELSGSS